jgi:anti-anti-sigma regulatory factor
MAKAQTISLKAQPAKGKGKSENEVTLIIQGELTIDNAQKLKEFLLEKIDKYNLFILTISNVVSLDLSAVQVLQRFVLDVKKMDKSIEASIDLPEDSKALLVKSGLDSFLAIY